MGMPIEFSNYFKQLSCKHEWTYCGVKLLERRWQLDKDNTGDRVRTQDH